MLPPLNKFSDILDRTVFILAFASLVFGLLLFLGTLHPSLGSRSFTDIFYLRRLIEPLFLSSIAITLMAIVAGRTTLARSISVLVGIGSVVSLAPLAASLMDFSWLNPFFALNFSNEEAFPFGALFILSPQSSLTCLLAAITVSVSSRLEGEVLFSPLLSVLSLAIVGMGLLTIVGHVSGVEPGYRWLLQAPQTWFAGCASLMIGAGLLVLIIRDHRVSLISTKEAWRLVTIYSTIGVIALCLMSVVLTAFPFFAILSSSVSPSLLSELHGKLLDFMAATVLVAALGALGVFTLVRFLIARVEEHRLDAVERKSITQALVRAAPDGIVRVDDSGRILTMNVAAELIFRKGEGAAQGCLLSSLLKPGEQSKVSGDILELLDFSATASVEGRMVEVVGVRSTGDFPVEISVSHMQVFHEKIYVIFLRDISERERAKHELQRSLQEKELLLKEVHHRVKNNLQIISSLLNLQRGRISEKDSTDVLRESQCRIQAMALLHELLYRKGDLSQVSFGSYLQELSDQLLRSFGMSRRVSLRLKTENVTLDIDKAVPCGLIVNELITNSLQHAFPGERSGVLTIQFSSSISGECILEVMDNGVGLSKDIDRSSRDSLGMRLIQSLVRQIDGKLEHSGPPGFGTRIRFSDQVLSNEELKGVSNL